MVKGDDGHGLVNQNFLRLLQFPQTGGGVGIGLGLIQQIVVLRVGPAGPVVAAAGGEAVEEGQGIVVVTHPTRTGDVEIQGIQRAEIGGPLLVAEIHLHPQLALPLGLDLDGHLLIEFRLVVENGDARKPFAVGIAGLAEESFGRDRTEGGSGRGSIAGHAAGREGKGDGFAPTGDPFHDGLLIDG